LISLLKGGRPHRPVRLPLYLFRIEKEIVYIGEVKIVDDVRTLHSRETERAVPIRKIAQASSNTMLFESIPEFGGRLDKMYHGAAHVIDVAKRAVVNLGFDFDEMLYSK